MDEEIAARFETLHQERKQRLEETARRTGAFQVHENTIEIQFRSDRRRRSATLQILRNPLKKLEQLPKQLRPGSRMNQPKRSSQLPKKMVKKQEPVKPVAEHKVQTPPILDGFPVGDETFEFPAMGELCTASAEKGAEKTVTAPDLPVEGETFEFPAVGGYAVPPQIEDTHPIEPLQPTEPTKPTEPVQPTEPKTPVKPRKAPKQTPEQPVELPATPVSTPEAPVHTEPGTPTVIPEMPVSPDMQPVVTPIRGEESASADTYSQEKPLQPRPGGRVRRADYRPAGVTPVHVVELHDYAEVILKEAKTYQRSLQSCIQRRFLSSRKWQTTRKRKKSLKPWRKENGRRSACAGVGTHRPRGGAPDSRAFLTERRAPAAGGQRGNCSAFAQEKEEIFHYGRGRTRQRSTGRSPRGTGRTRRLSKAVRCAVCSHELGSSLRELTFAWR